MSTEESVNWGLLARMSRCCVKRLRGAGLPFLSRWKAKRLLPSPMSALWTHGSLPLNKQHLT